MAVPDTGKSPVAFRADIKACSRDPPASGKDMVSARQDTQRAGIWVVSINSGLLQCMAARGNAVAPAPEYAAPYPGHDYLVDYPYGYSDPPYGAFDP